MKKTILTLLVLLFSILNTSAQIKQLGTSKPLSENNKSLNKLIVLNDGSTCHLEISEDYNIKLKTYDKDFNEIVSSTIQSKFGNIYNSVFMNLFEVANNQIVLTMTEYELGSNVFTYRFIIDTKTENLLNRINYLKKRNLLLAKILLEHKVVATYQE